MGLIIIGVGFPVFMGLMTWTKRHDLESEKVQTWHLYLYHAYRGSTCSWEAYRTVTLLCLVLLRSYLIHVAPVLRF